METNLTIQTWNIWFGGTKVNDGLSKQQKIVADFPSDILAIQECWGDCGQKLAETMGWNFAQQHLDTAVASKFPVDLIPTSTAPYATAAWVDTPAGRILVWSVHLSHIDYGPYEALKGATQEQVYASGGELTRLAQIREILSETQRLTTHEPVVVTGDFNIPATTDWQARSDRPNFVWPVTEALEAAGFSDAFRAIHPDAEQDHGNTWSPIEPLENEPRDRIDFIFTRGLEPVSANVIGNKVDENTDPSFIDLGGTAELIPNQADNTYPSDHQIVQATFRVS